MKLELLIFFLIFSNIFVWHSVFLTINHKGTEVYFFDVGQGSSSLIKLSNSVDILIDAGRVNDVTYWLERALAPTDKYIDLAILSHPHLDHYGGFIDILRNYEVGVFIYNGEKSDSLAYQELEKELKISETKTIVLKEGDRIKYAGNYLEVLSPSESLRQNKRTSVNDNSLVKLFQNKDGSLLFTGDISLKIFRKILDKYDNLNIDFLKVPHHGSRSGMDENILQRISPSFALISVGQKNPYGHPSKEIIDFLEKLKIRYFRTDQYGSVKLLMENKTMEVFRLK
ncbi:MAG: MBL fold metallo-hydrolase [Candidatus Liptonbacteria bacterium]|nr:MBL fold metallo-hydrolase [Candidatus Liptonbacteria bacterium]